MGLLVLLVIVQAIAIVMLVLLPLWGLSPWGHVVDYSAAGSWAEMISAFATAGALAAGFFTLFYQWSHDRAAEQRLRDKESTQLYVWLEPRNILEKGRDTRAWFLRFRNGIGYPIFQWVLEFHGGKSSGHLEPLRAETDGPILPGDTSYRLTALDEIAAADIPRCSIEFFDGWGRRWRRTQSGTVESISLGT